MRHESGFGSWEGGCCEDGGMVGVAPEWRGKADGVWLKQRAGPFRE